MADVKKNNFMKVLQCFMEEGKPLSVATLSGKTDLSHPTLSRIINRLQDIGLVRTESKIKGAQGRNACLYELNKGYTSVIGVYIGKDATHISLADFSGKNLADVGIPTKDADAAPLMERICAEVDCLLGAQFPGQTPAECVRAIGFCVSGRVQVDGPDTYVTAADIPRWGKIEIQSYIKTRYGIRCYVEKDTAASLIHSRKRLPRNTCENVVFLHIGTGIGFSVMIHGEIYKGARNMAGEARHMAVGQFLQPYIQAAGGNAGGDESLSGLERLYGIRSILREAYDIYTRFDDTILAESVANMGGVINSASDMKIEYVDLAARCGDHRIIYLLHDHIMMWASIITNIACCLAPELFIVGGSIGVETPYITGRIQEQLDKNPGLPISLLAADNHDLMHAAASNYTVYRLYRELRTQIAENFDEPDINT